MTFWSKLLGSNEHRLENHIWDMVIDFCNEGITLINLSEAAFSDGPQFETTRALLDRMDEFIHTISKEMINYDDVIYPEIFNVQLRPHINVSPDQEPILEFFNMTCSIVNEKIGKIRGRIDNLDFIQIAEVNFKDQSQEFFQNWLFQWEGLRINLSAYRIHLKNMKKFWTENNVPHDDIFQIKYGLLYWLELEIGKTTMVDILSKWFEKDGSMTLTISPKTSQLLTVLERETNDKIAIFIDDMDAILTLLSPEQKEHLFDKLQVIRKKAFVFYTSSTPAGHLTVYDYGRLGLDEAIKYTTF